MSFLIRIRDLLFTNAERWLEPKLAELPLRSAVDWGITGLMKRLKRKFRHWTRPQRGMGSPVIGAIGDLRRSKAALVLENSLLRKQLSILGRQVRRPRFKGRDRLAILTLARLLPNWREALLIVKPATVLGWHRRLFEIYWRRRSRPRPPRLMTGTAALIRRIALENVSWGAERIRGELLKLGVRVSKRTVQRMMWKARRDTDPNAGQSWRNFVSNHHRQLWACDFVQVHDILFRAVFAFFIIDVPTRRVVHVGVTRCPTDRWVTQQLREATAWGRAPKYLLLDNDSKFGVKFEELAEHTGIKLVHTAVHAPLMNSVCERFIGSVRRECLDHMLILSEVGMLRLVEEYVSYFNASRPHQGLAQQIPNRAVQGAVEPPVSALPTPADSGVVSVPVLGGLHHHYYRLAA